MWRNAHGHDSIDELPYDDDYEDSLTATTPHLLVLAVLSGWTSATLATSYTFMSVSGTNVPGNGTTVSTFTSGLGNGTITVDHISTTQTSLGNWGTATTSTPRLTRPSSPHSSPATDNVQGHVAQSMYGDPCFPGGSPVPIPNVTTVTFHLNSGYTGYFPISSLEFGTRPRKWASPSTMSN